MYLDLDVKSMIKLYESNLGNITDSMIFSEIKKNNYDPEEVFSIITSDKFIRRLDYNTKDEFTNFRKLIDATVIRKRIVSHNLFEIKNLVDTLNYIKENNIELFQLYYNLIKLKKDLIDPFNHYNPRGNAIESIIKPIEDSLRNEMNPFEAGISITSMINEFSISPELSMIILYSFSNLGYYANELIRYCEDIDDINIDTFYNELYRLTRTGVLSYKIDGFIEMMTSIDNLISNHDPFLRDDYEPELYIKPKGIVPYTMRSHNHLFKLRDAITRFIMENNL